MKAAIEVLDALENIHRAQRAGVYAPHHPLPMVLVLARVQHGELLLVGFKAIDALLKKLLAEFGPCSAAGLEAAHIRWHLVGGLGIEPNGLSLCALHQMCFDPGLFSVGPAEHCHCPTPGRREAPRR